MSSPIMVQNGVKTYSEWHHPFKRTYLCAKVTMRPLMKSISECRDLSTSTHMEDLFSCLKLVRSWRIGTHWAALDTFPSWWRYFSRKIHTFFYVINYTHVSGFNKDKLAIGAEELFKLKAEKKIRKRERVLLAAKKDWQRETVSEFVEGKRFKE